MEVLEEVGKGLREMHKASSDGNPLYIEEQ